MNFIPIDDRVIVELLNDDQKVTRGGLFVPDTARNFKHRLVRKGKIIAVGRKVSPERVAVGEIVGFLNHDGFEIPAWPGHDHEDGTVRSLRESELMFKIEGDPSTVEGRHQEPEDHQKWWDKK